MTAGDAPHLYRFGDMELATVYGLLDGVRANMITSVNGDAAPAGGSDELADPPDRQLLRTLRDLADAVIVGAETLRAERYRSLAPPAPRQAARRAAGLASQPTLVVVTDSGEGLASHPAIAGAPVRAIVLTRVGSAAANDSGLGKVAEVVQLGESTVDLTAGLATLRQLGMTRLLTEGGPRLLSALLTEQLVDELCVTVAGQLTAGTPTPLVTLGEVRQLQLRHAIAAGDTLLLRYTVRTAGG